MIRSLLPLVALVLPPASPLPGDFVRAITFEASRDVTGDGIQDFLLGLPRDDAHGRDAGRVFVLDGRRGAVLREIHDGVQDAGFGFSVTSGDFDGDGKTELAIASHRDGFTDETTPAGCVVLASPVDGAIQRRLRPPAGSVLGVSFASVVRCIGDADRDGADDLLILSREEARLDGRWESPALVFSGKDGSVLRAIEIPQGWLASPLADMNGDEVDDFALMSGNQLQITSLRDGKVIGSTWRPAASCAIRAVLSAGDVDGDGVVDVAVLAKKALGDFCETLSVSSGKDGTLLFEVPGTRMRNQAGAAALSGNARLQACAIGDTTGDKAADMIVSLPDSGFVALFTRAEPMPAWKTQLNELRQAGEHPFLSSFGQEMTSVGDIDRDGVPDVAVASTECDTSWPYEKASVGVRILSGAKGNVLMSITPTPGGDPRVLATRPAPSTTPAK